MITVEKIAEICHETNRAYCATIGDYSQDAWAFSPKWQKDSAINGVKFSIEHPEATPEDSHRNWFVEKFADGWKYGPEKDVVNKLHPCMMPYGSLPDAQRIKDALFMAVVKALA